MKRDRLGHPQSFIPEIEGCERHPPELFGGARFSQLPRRQRVAHTKTALTRPESLAAIASALGLSDARSLSRIFRHHPGRLAGGAVAPRQIPPSGGKSHQMIIRATLAC